MDVFEAAYMASLAEGPLTPQEAGKLTIMTLERHAVVREAMPRGGAQGIHRHFDIDGPGGGEPAAGAERAPGEGEASEEEEEENVGGIEYDDAGAISVSVPVAVSREYFGKIQSRHKDPVTQPQEWFDLVVSGGEQDHEEMDRRNTEVTTQRMGSGWLGGSRGREREE